MQLIAQPTHGRRSPETASPQPSLELALLPPQLGQRAATHRPPAGFGGVGKQADTADPIVFPTWIVEDGVKADALDQHAAVERFFDLEADIVQLGGTGRAFRAGFGDEHRAP